MRFNDHVTRDDDGRDGDVIAGIVYLIRSYNLVHCLEASTGYMQTNAQILCNISNLFTHVSAMKLTTV